ncbi:DUF1906 domain-containing protein [Streptacidiphilus sp. EB129]|uniref:DUF1906 domain-containing protein n=1 Tax=Streptacidiphilus sp. EB129 TaxID=3156262 RepID=UPI003515A7DC
MTTLRTAVAATHASLSAAVLALVCVAGTIIGVTPAGAQESGAAAHVFTGQAFDTCAAPALGELHAWHRSSPYGALGIYVGGRNRACSQPRLSHAWARSAVALGWQLLPLYVGSQAPCVTKEHRSTRIDPRRAIAEGVDEGRDAARALRGLGFRPGSPVYLDMEDYARDGGRCTLAVLQYTAAWSQTVRSAGYLAGFYSSSDSGIADLAAVALQRHPATNLPDVVWYARWDARASTDGFRALGHGQWVAHRRLHQFYGNTDETHGGVRMLIDRNAVDAPVAIVG